MNVVIFLPREPSTIFILIFPSVKELTENLMNKITISMEVILIPHSQQNLCKKKKVSSVIMKNFTESS